MRISFTNTAKDILALAIFVLVAFQGSEVLAHGGGIDKIGCHHNRRAGGYHCHRGPLRGQRFASKREALNVLSQRQGRGGSPSRRRSVAPPPSINWPRWTGPKPKPVASVGTNSQTPKSLYKLVEQSVYVLYAASSLSALRSGGPVSQGSAVAVTTSHALTNCHVLAGGRVYYLRVDGQYAQVRITHADPNGDRCIIEASEVRLVPVPYMKLRGSFPVGERVYTLGSPQGLEKTLGEGIISGLREKQGISLIQTTAPISPGSSGGGLFDHAGNLIGITTFLLKESQNLNFAISVSEFFR